MKVSPADYINELADLRPTQQEVFQTLWYDEVYHRTFHVAKRRAGKTVLALRTAFLLALCAAGHIPPVSDKQKRLISLHHKGPMGERPAISDPFKIGFFTAFAGQIDVHINDTIWQFVQTWPEGWQKLVKHNRSSNIWRIIGKTPEYNTSVVVKGIKRLTDGVRGAGFDVIFLDEAQTFAYDDIQRVLLPTMSQTQGLGWAHFFGTANINNNSKEFWELIRENPRGKCFKTTAYDCLNKDIEYTQAAFEIDKNDSGGEHSDVFQAEYLCNFDIPPQDAILGHWDPEYVDNVSSPAYILGIDIGITPFTLQKFYVDDNKELVYSHRKLYYNENVNLTNIVKENVDENCRAIMLPHDAKEINKANGLTHYQDWRNTLNEQGLYDVDLKLLKRHARIFDRIVECNNLINKVKVIKTDRKIDHVHQLKQARTEQRKDESYRVRPDFFSHLYDAFSYGVIGYYNYYIANKHDIEEITGKEYNDMVAFITGDHTKSVAYGKREYQKAVDRSPTVEIYDGPSTAEAWKRTGGSDRFLF